MTSNDVVRLAALVVEKILNDESLCRRVIERNPKPQPPDCPPHTLCCSKNHVCDPKYGGFSCSPPYRCQNGFEDRIGRF